MNYFSHFYVLPTYSDPYLTFGSILPDLLRNAKSELATISTNKKSFKSEQQSIIEGVINHIEVDKWFHNSPFFFELTKVFSKSIRESNEVTMNKYTQFYAHILLELLVDYALIKEEKKLLEKFYIHLFGINIDTVRLFIIQNFPSQDFELFWEQFDRFRTRKFLEDYVDLKKVIQFSFYVYEKTTKLEIDKTQLFDYESLIERSFMPLIEKKYRNLFDKLKTTE